MTQKNLDPLNLEEGMKFIQAVHIPPDDNLYRHHWKPTKAEIDCSDNCPFCKLGIPIKLGNWS